MKLTESRLRSIIRSVIAEEHGRDEHGRDEHGYKSFEVAPEDRRDLEASLRAAEGPGEPELSRSEREELEFLRRERDRRLSGHNE